MKKRLSFLVVSLAFLTNFAIAQNKSIPLSTVRNGWGWGCEFSYAQANPNISAGVGCSAATVTKVSFVGNNWSGSFGVVDSANIFAWSSITDWSKYNKIEFLVYPEVTCSFDDTISYKGYNNTKKANVVADVASMETKSLLANQWNKVSIDLTVALKDKSDNSIIYTSLGDVNFGLNNIQFNYIGLGAASGNIYFGAITLKDKNATGSSLESEVAFGIYPNPAKSSIKVATENEENATVIITSLSGIQLLSQKADSKETTVDVSSLSAGIYIVTIVSAQGTKSEKLNIN